jgi:glycosyltransferase involved in cell wall biosynthesis
MAAISNNFLFFVRMYFLSIIIPLYNEETLIAEVVKQVLAVQLPPSVDQYEIVIVDDCSSDRSFEVVTALAAQNNLIKVLKHEQNMGKGAAVRTGIAAASGNIFLIQDADLELRPADIPGMINCMEELNVEFINGSRYLAGVYRPLSSYKRYLGNRFFTSLTAIIINVKITDMACGYKLIHRNLFEKIKLNENRFGFEAELIIKALRIKKNNIAEIPVHYFPRNEGEGKKFRNSDALKILWTIIKCGLFKAD